MIELKPPQSPTEEDLERYKVFLAGSISNGQASLWQPRIVDSLKDYDITVFNPRRDNWDSSWEQTIRNPQFKEQVLWEMWGVNNSDFVLYYIEPDSLSPITLFELGLRVQQNILEQNIAIYCPRGFWRRGNIEVISNYYRVPLFEEEDEFIKHVQWAVNCHFEDLEANEY